MTGLLRTYQNRDIFVSTEHILVFFGKRYYGAVVTVVSHKQLVNVLLVWVFDEEHVFGVLYNSNSHTNPVPKTELTYRLNSTPK